MKKYARRLKRRRDQLLRHYDEEELHQLRVTLRRMRSILKQIPGGKARALRRDLGALADATNAARDWDTLVLHARDTLSPEQFSSLAPWMEWLRGAARGRVISMLRSDEWTATVKRWQRYRARLARSAPDGRRSGTRAMAETLEALAVAQHKALAKDDAKRWHRLRIAIKDLRYLLDDIPGIDRGKRVRRAIAACRALQDDLGAWHDTVVHLELVRETSEWIDPASHPRAADALATLRQVILQEGSEQLERVRSTLHRPEVQRALSPDGLSAS